MESSIPPLSTFRIRLLPWKAVTRNGLVHFTGISPTRPICHGVWSRDAKPIKQILSYERLARHRAKSLEEAAGRQPRSNILQRAFSTSPAHLDWLITSSSYTCSPFPEKAGGCARQRLYFLQAQGCPGKCRSLAGVRTPRPVGRRLLMSGQPLAAGAWLLAGARLHRVSLRL